MTSSLVMKIRSFPWKRIFDISGWIVGLGALVVGVVHVRELQQTTHELGAFETKFSQDTAEIKQSLPTHFEGQFPDFFPAILQTVGAAQHEIIIVADFPSYADFSDPARSLMLRYLIESKSQSGVSVQLTCLSSKSRRDALLKRISRSQFDSLTSQADGRERVRQYTSSAHVPISQRPYDDLLAAIEENNRMTLMQTFRRAVVTPTDADIPIFFWIADRRHCVMVVPTRDGHTEYGFKTSDSSLIGALVSARDRYTASSP